MKTPSYLDRLNGYEDNFAHFIPRVPGVETTADRLDMIERLRPAHERVMREAGIAPKYLRRAQQVHGNRLALVGDIGCSCPVEGVDGLICSGKSDCCLGIYVADCAAVWLYDPVNHVRALLHSGKLGTQQNIVAHALDGMRRFFGSNAGDCVAVISPCIRPPHYEVDIPAAITQQLLDGGVPSAHITDSGLDTAADLDTFYSYRQEKGNTGRMLALFGLPHVA